MEARGLCVLIPRHCVVRDHSGGMEIVAQDKARQPGGGGSELWTEAVPRWKARNRGRGFGVHQSGEICARSVPFMKGYTFGIVPWWLLAYSSCAKV